MTTEPLVERITAFVRDPRRDGFDALARDVVRFQRERVAAYGNLCRHRGLGAELADWRDAPLVPTAAFKTLRLAAAPAVEVFRSSGTGGARSEHHQPFPDLYREIVERSFPAACLHPGERPPILSLVPPRAVAPDSSLAFMVDHALARWGDPAASLAAVGAAGLDPTRTRSWLAARQRDRRPAVVVTTSLALADLLERLARLDLRFRLPAGSRIVETGGFKTRGRELSPTALAAGVAERLGLGPEATIREYGMAELTSQCYSRTLAGGDPDVLVPPPWMRVRLLDAERLTEVAPGELGLVAVFDLGNVGSAAHVLTEDLAVGAGDGFRLQGRAAGAELRGCSLLSEELAG